MQRAYVLHTSIIIFALLLLILATILLFRMATEAEASREARAKVVAAEGEQKASIALKEAADTINKRFLHK